MGQTEFTKQKQYIIPLILTFLAAVALRLHRLGSQSLWYDESFSVFVSGQDLVTLTQHTARDIHPPLYYYLLHFWMEAAGKSEFSVAFLSLFFGLLTVALAFAVAKRLFGPGVAFMTGLLVALSPFHLWYSQEVRMYTIATSLGLLTTWFVIILLELKGGDGTESRAGKWLPWVGYVLSAVLSLYLLYYLAFFLVFINLFVLAVLLGGRRFFAHGLRMTEPTDGMTKPLAGMTDTEARTTIPADSFSNRVPGAVILRNEESGGSNKSFLTGSRSLLLKWIAAQVAVLIIYLPWLPTAVSQAIWPAVPPWREFMDFGSVIVQSWTALSLGQSVDAAKVWPILLLFLVVYIAGLLSCDSWLKGALLFGSVWIPVLIIFLISLYTPLFFVRYVFIYSPLFFLTLALGLNRLKAVSVPVFLLTTFSLLGGFAASSNAYYTDNRYVADDFRSALNYIEERWHPGDALLLNAGYIYTEATYYFNDPIAWRGRLADYPNSSITGNNGLVVLQTGSIGADSRLGGGNPKADFYPTTTEEVQRNLEVVAQRHSRVWVLRCYDTVTDPQGFIRSWLDQNAQKFEDLPFTGTSVLRVQGYLFPGSKETVVTNPVSFAGKLSLVKSDIFPKDLNAGEKVFVDLAWRSDSSLEDVRSYLTLIDANGRVWQQQDIVPVSKLLPASRWPKGQETVDRRQFRVLPGTPPGTYRLQLGVYSEKTGQHYDAVDGKGVSQGPQLNLGEIRIDSAARNQRPPEMKVQTNQDLGDGIRLLGYNPGAKQAKPGDSIHLEFLWQAMKSGIPDQKVKLVTASSSDGKRWPAREAVPVDGRYPFASWKDGELVRDQHDLLIPANLPDGYYDLIIGIGNSERKLYQLKIEGRKHSFDLPTSIQFKKEALFGTEIKFLGFDLKSSGSDAKTIKAGDPIQITLYWQAEKEVGQNYKVFLQLLDGANKIRGQRDFIPGDGTLPTSGWVKGEVITEGTTIVVNKDAPSGQLRLVLGMYEPTTGKRTVISEISGQTLGDALEVVQLEVK